MESFLGTWIPSVNGHLALCVTGQHPPWLRLVMPIKYWFGLFEYFCMAVIRQILVRENQKLDADEKAAMEGANRARVEEAAKLEGITFEKAMERRKGYRYLYWSWTCILAQFSFWLRFLYNPLTGSVWPCTYYLTPGNIIQCTFEELEGNPLMPTPIYKPLPPHSAWAENSDRTPTHSGFENTGMELAIVTSSSRPLERIYSQCE